MCGERCCRGFWKLYEKVHCTNAQKSCIQPWQLWGLSEMQCSNIHISDHTETCGMTFWQQQVAGTASNSHDQPSPSSRVKRISQCACQAVSHHMLSEYSKTHYPFKDLTCFECGMWNCTFLKQIQETRRHINPCLKSVSRMYRCVQILLLEPNVSVLKPQITYCTAPVRKNTL